MAVEHATRADEPAIRALFRATVALGRPLPFAEQAPTLVAAYERLCLDWYLDPSSPAVVGVLRDGPDRAVHGYALVCLAGAEHTRAQRRAAGRFARSILPLLIPGRSTPEVTGFLRRRLADAWTLRQPPAAVRDLPHAHVNARPGPSSALPGRQLAAFVDETCSRAGQPRWYGEVNARSGRRLNALTAYWGAELVERSPNRTLTWLLGEPVERLTICRAVRSHAPDAAAA